MDNERGREGGTERERDREREREKERNICIYMYKHIERREIK